MSAETCIDSSCDSCRMATLKVKLWVIFTLHGSGQCWLLACMHLHTNDTRLPCSAVPPHAPALPQSNLTPAHDIFLGSHTPVASIVALPLLRQGLPLGGLILTAAETTDFAAVKGTLRHLVAFLGPLLCRRLGDQLAAVAAAARTRRSPGSVTSHKKVTSLTSVAEDAVVAVAGGSTTPSMSSRSSASSGALTSVSRAQGGPGSSGISSPLAGGSSGWTSSSLALTGVGAVPAALLPKRSSHSALLEVGGPTAMLCICTSLFVHI
jgi:hypothetical protein